MRPPQSSRRGRAGRVGLAGFAAASVAAAGLFTFAPAASADTALEGSGDWGVKESFRNYVGGPIADGEVTPSEGASRNDDGTFAWPLDSGTADAESGEFTVQFSGSVAFEGHDYGQGAVLEVHVANPRVEGDEDGATVYADLSSREFHGADPNIPPGEMVDYGTVAVADLDGVDVAVAEDTLTVTTESGSLREEAVAGFAEFYDAGDAMDPFAFTASLDSDDGGGETDPDGPSVELSKSTDLDPEGETVEVTGTGFAPDQGVYAMLTATLPEEGEAPSGQAPGAAQAWIRADAIDDDGTFTAEIEVVGSYTLGDGDDEEGEDGAEDQEVVDCLEDQCYVLVANDHTAITDRSQDVATPVSFAQGEDSDDEGGEREIVDGSGDWGVKESFRNYLGSPVADGEITPSEGASRNDDGTFAWPVESGTADSDSGEFSVQFSGSVAFEGHDYGSGPVLEVHVANPRVEGDEDGATVYADLSSREFNGADPSIPPGDLVEFGTVAVAELDGVDATFDDDAFSFDSEAGSLHAEAVEGFADFYDEGDPMDPFSFATTTQPGGDGNGNGDEDEDPIPETGDIVDGRIDWGVKESFRTYIEGDIAEGSISVSDDARRNDDGTFAFRYTEGALTPPTADLSFGGTVLFDGHDYGSGPELELTLSDPRVEFDGADGTLFADVTSRGLIEGELVDYPDVALADLEVSDADIDGDLIVWEDIPAELTSDGVPAFDHFYMEGDALDPVTITLTTSEDVDLWGDGDDKQGPGDGAGGGGGLPQTGPGILAIVLAAVALTATGTALMVRRRKGIGTTPGM
ncbi:HtaA domain-containing protein [Spiractinospora alimapuensis]|uniref:HtaA domain-containing protein n=1 Tax=Spiractinospora alimapuensis TaxID=2820884 RepID=UPI001F2E66C8|nr:HtaA domain-containing protein [Spiractinospora alimapuensis]QVQ54197.1 HtaA domain-containing protein [Spiractinospora alimapuensis]